MRTLTDFSPLWRSTIGFDHMIDALQSAVNAGYPENYPPYNIEKVDDDSYHITMAVAGFTENELSITAEPNLLTVAGNHAGERVGELIYQGIAGRGFRRQFRLADYIEVKGAELRNGLLTIHLARELPEEMRPRQIEITSGAGSAKIQHMHAKEAA